ncbi:hypothetical protein T05_9824 [Trichinella murrelli]|uniref:Uncharacterized protein n=1 Tax=Trichinella murrelli TaxID=144512 RepID=A0A0V0SSX2_9BILA|nr:hypothetical protein T05_9824 [Trichinella murrelli]
MISIAFYHPCHCGDFNKQSGCPWRQSLSTNNNL